MTVAAVSIGGVPSLLVSNTQSWTPEYDLNEKIWLDWNSTSLTDGLVSTWKDSVVGISASQVVTANQPVKSAAAGGVVFSSSDSLGFANFSDPTRYHRAVAMLCKADITAAGSGNGTLFCVNGYSGGTRAPFIGYSKGTPNNLQVQWGSSASTQSLINSPWPSDTGWHFILSRRVNGVHKVSIDGGTELTDGTNVLIQRDNVNQVGIIGDFRNPSISWTCKRVLLLQNELTDDEVARFQGWAMWTMGVQANLPGGHPYFSAAPKSKPWTNTYPMITDAAFVSTQASGWWTTTAQYKQNYGNPIAGLISGYTQDFLEDFTSIAAIADEAGAPGATATMFSPVIDATGGTEIARSPIQSPNVFAQSGTELTITMQQVGGVGAWYSSSLCSINIDGRGYTFDPSKAPFYVEWKFRILTGSGHSLWTALWLKPLSEFYNGTTGHFENDLCESYNGENSGQNQHVTIHSWPAPRPYGNRNSLHKLAGKDFALDVAHAWPGAPVSIADNAYHTIGCLFDKNLTGTFGGPGFFVTNLDGNELMRAPLQANLLQPTYLITSFSQLPSEAGLATGTYTMGIDYIKILKGTNY